MTDLAGRSAGDGGYGAVIHRLGVGHAPVNVVVYAHAVARSLAFVEVTQATSASNFPAAIVVTH